MTTITITTLLYHSPDTQLTRLLWCIHVELVAFVVLLLCIMRKEIPYYLLTAIPIFPLALAAVDVDGFPFTLRLAFKASRMSVVSSGSSSSSLETTF
jgi:hypothetical protein